MRLDPNCPRLGVKKRKREENLQVALICLRPTQLSDLMPLIRIDIKKYFIKQNRIWGIEFQLITKKYSKGNTIVLLLKIDPAFLVALVSSLGIMLESE